MNNSLAPSSRMSAWTMAALMILALVSAESFAAERPRSAGQAGSAGASGNTSVNGELQRLFNESGQQMPSMQTADLPYATTPQMDRVRKRGVKPAELQKKKKGLFNKFFGRFRRDKSDEEAATPEPPPIEMGDSRAVIRRSDKTAGSKRMPQQPRDVAGHQSQSVQQPQQLSTQPVQNRRIVRQPSQPQNAVAEQTGSSIPHVDMASQDKFVNPFEDADSFSDGEVRLDLDAIGEIPDVADKAVFSSTDSFDAGFAEASESVEPAEAAPNPFSGLQIPADDEFESLFEESIVDADVNESLELDEAARLIPQTSLALSQVDDSGFAEYNELLNPSKEAMVDSTSVETQETTFSDSEWQARFTSDDLSSVQRENGFGSGERRLAKVDRVPAERQQARRWWQASDTGEGVEHTTGDQSFSEYVAVNPAAAAPKATPQQTRRQKIKSRRHLPGFMGFCPVKLREDRDLADASDEHEARFGLNTYHFSSLEARDRFKANPTRYAPAAGGADVVALVNSGEQHAGSLEFAMWYRDRLYLFHSHETIGLFREDPASFADQY
jgi:YHS domain-containing protein